MRTRNLLLTLLLCAAPGCAAGPAMTFEREVDDSDPLPAAVDMTHRPALGVLPYEGPYRLLHRRVVGALTASGDYARVVDLGVQAAEEPVDALVKLDYATDGGGRWYNAFTCFPGFLFFLPSAVKLRWDYALDTSLELRRPHGEDAALRWSRHDAYHLAYTPDGYTITSYLGWGALLFTPMGAFPLGAGIASVFDCPDLQRVTDAFADTPAGHRYAQGVAHGVSAKVEARRAESLAGR